MPDVFLSYKRENLKAATRLVAALRAEGLEAWWDRDIPPGAPWEAAIETALAEARVVLVCWSKAAVASDNVRSEARWAREQGRLIQLFVEPCNPPLFFGERQGVDLADWNGDARDPRFRQLVAAIRAVTGENMASTRAPPSAAIRPTSWWPRLGRRPPLWLSAAAIAVIAVGILAWTALHGVHARGPGQAPGGARQAERVAVPRFDIPGAADADLAKFAGGLQAEMVGQLNQNQINVAVPDQGSRDAAGLGASYAFGGSVERDGDRIRVRMQLNDARQHVTVWTGDYGAPAKSVGVLQDEVAAEAAEVAHSALGRDPFSNGDAELTSLGIKSDLYSYRDLDEDRESEWENAKLLLAKIPKVSTTHSNFAIVSAFLAAISTPERAAELRTLAAREADAALHLNPRDPLAVFARFLLIPMVGHWREREGLLLAGLKASPDNGLYTTHESNLLREVGRLQEALTWGRQAAAPKPATANRDSTLLIGLAEAGENGEASSLADTAGRQWPTHSAVWSARLQTFIHQARWTDALALFHPDAYHPDTIGEDERRAWVAALKAMASGAPAAKRDAATLLAAIPAKPSSASLPPHLVYAPADRIGMLAILGATDAAFVKASEYLSKDGAADSSFLFWPDLTVFRRDKRFWPFVSRIGLVDYWRAAGKWPDFCSEPGLPYDCRTGAAKPVGAAPARS